MRIRANDNKGIIATNIDIAKGFEQQQRQMNGREMDSKTPSAPATKNPVIAMVTGFLLFCDKG